MTTAVQNQETTFQYINKNDLLSVLKKQLSVLPDTLGIAIFPMAKITVPTEKAEKKPKERIYTPEEIKEITANLPILKISKKQEISIDEGVREIEKGKYRTMTAKEAIAELES